MIISLLYIIYFYLFSVLLSLVGFSFSFRLFSKLKDKGYAFSRLITLVLFAFLSWFILSFTKSSYSFFALFLIFSIITCLSLIQFITNRKQIFEFIHNHKKIVFLEEGIFIAFFIFFIAVRFGNPDLWHPVMGGEKPMDFAFLNAIARTNTLPPYDPWFAGSTINYYYFGQFIAGTIVKFLQIPPNYFYNIFLAYLFAQCSVGIFSIVHAFTNSRKISFLGSLILLCMGNLAQIPLIYKSFFNSIPINGWYWTATRIMPNYEINEFPFFTFIYGDLHSHLIAIPIALLLIAILYQITTVINFKHLILLSIFSGLIIGILYITNVWDYPTYIMLTVLIVMNSIFVTIRKTSLLINLLRFLLLVGIVIGTSTIAALPFTNTFRTGPLGLALFEGPYTTISDYLIIHGFFIFVSVSYVFTHAKYFSLKKLTMIGKIPIVLLLCFFITLVVFKLYFLAFITLLVTPFIVLLSYKRTPAKRFVLVILITAFLITAIPDTIDFRLGLGRMNTVFKFYFQAWILFSVASPFLIYQTLKQLKSHALFRIIFLGLLSLLLISGLSYMPTSTIAKINDRMSKQNNITLDGEEYMKNSLYFDNNTQINLLHDYQAIQWIKKNISDNSVLLEANTPIYRWGSRISIYTGLPTVLGWEWHEIAHRQYLNPTLIQVRASDIGFIYNNSDPKAIKEMLDHYNIKYIYLGKLEKIYYNTTGFENIIKSDTNFKKIYSNNEVQIYSYKK